MVIAAPIILSCAGMGYAISLVMPLAPIPVGAPLASEVTDLKAAPVSPAGSAKAAARPVPAERSEPAELNHPKAAASSRVESVATPVEAQGPANSPVGLLATGSVDQASAPARGVDEKAVPPALETQAAADAEPESQASEKRRTTRGPTKRPKRFFRRPTQAPIKPAQPLQQFWSLFQ